MVEPKITPTNLIAPIQCPQCSEKGYIIRRWHDPFSRAGSEVWTFQCELLPIVGPPCLVFSRAFELLPIVGPPCLVFSRAFRSGRAEGR
jgi:hypothetical protein